MSRLLPVIAFILVAHTLIAQRVMPFYVEAKQQKTVPEYISSLKQEINADTRSNWHSVSTTIDEQSGLEHHRYRQTIQGIPVVTSTIILHTREGKVERTTGYAYTGRNAVTTPRIDAELAARIAQQSAPTGKIAVHHTELVFVDRFFPKHSGILQLAFAVELSSKKPYNRWRTYVDALTGELIVQEPLMAHATVPGKGETTYYGTVDIDVDSLGPSEFLLQDADRGVFVRSNELGNTLRSSSSTFDLSAEVRGTMAVDVYYGAQRFYDLLQGSFGWLGVDGNGEPMRSFVLDVEGDNFVNAYWDGSEATFGAGDCHYNPLTTIDVVGHEFAHGITQYTSQLIYSGESGALNEAFSDIYGKALEYLEQPDQFTWTLGNRFADSRYARPFRSMEDPLLYGNPKVYQGTNWFPNGGVHTNSGPMGHWFYLLVEGGTGTNELGTDYTVAPLGIDEAFRIAFLLNRDYLTESSSYSDAYDASLLYAESVFGLASAEYTSIVEAWKAIGLPVSGPSTLPIDLSISGFGTDSPITCHPQDSTIATVILINQGRELPAGTEVIVSLDLEGNVGSRTLTFDEPFKESEFYFQELSFPVTAPDGEYFATLSISLSGDAQPTNNEANQEITIKNEPVDIKIQEIAWDQFRCDDGIRTGFVTVRNTGCEDINGDLTISFYDRDDNIIKQFDRSVSNLLPGFRNWINIDVTYQEALALHAIEIKAENEVSLLDNLSETSANVVAALLPDLLIDFEEPAEQFDIIADQFDSGVIGRIPYQSGHVFATTGGTYFGNTIPCLDPEVSLLARRSSQAPSTCIDMTGVSDVVFEFDLIHLHGNPNPNYPELSDVARALEVFWLADDGDYGSRFIPSQPDGQRTKQTLPLPPNFIGQVGFNIYNATGRNFLYELEIDRELEQYDYTLLDNLGVRTSLSTSQTSSKITLAPNPASSYVELENPTGFRQNVLVISSLGVVVFEDEMLDSQLIITDQWAPGYYTILLSGEDGKRQYFKLMIVH